MMSTKDIFFLGPCAILGLYILASWAVLLWRRKEGIAAHYPDHWSPDDHAWLRRAQTWTGVAALITGLCAILVIAYEAHRLGGWPPVRQLSNLLFLPAMLTFLWLRLITPQDWSRRKVSLRMAAILTIITGALALTTDVLHLAQW